MEDLEDQLDEDFAWRRAEMHSLLSQVRASTPGPAQRCLCRAGVALLYAHWEGYTKLALARYLKFVSRRKLQASELSPNFLARAVEHSMRRGTGKTETEVAIERIKWIIENEKCRPHIPNNEEIDTKSNLNSEVCKDLFISLGLDFSPLATKVNLIDYELLRSRNKIAHGEYVAIDNKDYIALHDDVLEIMDTVRRLVSTAASQKLYRR
ncbi:MAE_28990/MAE_18760 family HEPN-like nuclease [Saccharopolyspora sp. K220]|uniref:MAE_28990/MAE_18760 family HEPN-like nuclease n=1 Tax=Saccharopolyspora soli TaxID=2926618 RepID=UPI001F563AA4|nr:MAE_28990/MAE_18760 family HEPN-like nuclease [Saccharopolyspora soli]MCI2421828.1 MAE_28990/MAE_18760 family HEPN-like nuclease [Saccharopolyspora soli]